MDRVVLKNEIAEAIENRTALVDFNAECHMRSMTEDRVAARIDGAAGEIDPEFSRVLHFCIAPGGHTGGCAELVVVKRKYLPIGLTCCLANGFQIAMSALRTNSTRALKFSSSNGFSPRVGIVSPASAIVMLPSSDR